MFSSIKKIFTKKTQMQKTAEYRDGGSLYIAKIALHTGESMAALGHIALWLSLFEKKGYAYCIITRTRTAFNAIKEKYPTINLVYAKSPQDIESVLQNLNVKIIFYTSNTGNNLHICRFTEYHHIFLGHGDSNKSSSAHNGFKIYDEVWVSGQAHIDRFKRTGVDMAGTQVKIIGQPQLEYIQKERVEKNYFLYLPTWEGIYTEQSYSSLPIAKELFYNNNITKLAIKFHPLTGTKNSQYKTLASSLCNTLRQQGIKGAHYPQHINVLDIMPLHSGYICDTSATVTSALFWGCPIFVYTPQDPHYIQGDIDYQEFCYTFTSPEEFRACMEGYRENGDTMAKQRESIVDYFISRSAIANGHFQKYIDDALCN